MVERVGLTLCHLFSFIKYVLKKQVQKAGVAPTDDGFTIIAPGSVDADQVYVFLFMLLIRALPPSIT